MALRDTLIEHYTKNPNEMDPKFGGDATKAADATLNLQAAYTQATQKLAELNKPAPAPVPNPLSIPKPSDSAVWTELENEIRETGAVSDATRSKLEAANVPGHLITKFVEAHQVHQRVVTEQGVALLGGQEEFNKTIQFAQTLPPHEVEALNKGLASEAWSIVLQGLHARRLSQGPNRQSNEPNRRIAPNAHNGVTTPAGATTINTYDNLIDNLRRMRNPNFQGDREALKTHITQGVARLYSKNK